MSAVLEVKQNLVAQTNGNSNGASVNGVMTQRLITVADYDRMIEHGILTENDRVELMNGRIVNQMPKGTRHTSITSRLNRFFVRLFGESAIVRVQDPMILDDLSEPEPDLVVAKPNDSEYLTHHPKPEDVLLIVEISDSTLLYDREEKGAKYAEANIAHYVLIDLQNSTIEDYRNPSANGYETKQTLRVGQSFNLVAFPEITVNVDEILRVES
ncbi:MAG: Uma2 family endonuclease [Pyrinomonadaceae bacterium]|nr:Uma2 family endonuclease [Pyrinomonadaceae bacterium]